MHANDIRAVVDINSFGVFDCIYVTVTKSINQN